MAKILIVNSGPLWQNPRSVKEADALSQVGHDVTIAGIWLDAAAASRDAALLSGKRWTFCPALDLSGTSFGDAVKKSWARARRRFAVDIGRAAGVVTAELHGYGARQLLRVALAADADLTIAHSEIGLHVGKRLIDSGRRVGVDFEDWFSNDIAPAAAVAARVKAARSLERLHAQACRYSVAPSAAMAAALAEQYQAQAPMVVYNAFPEPGVGRTERGARDRTDPSVPSLHWFSQTIGPGRGLELLFKALPDIAVPFELHLRGALSDAHRRWLDRQLDPAFRDRVFVHDVVPNAELHARIAEHDVGLCLETSAVRSRDLTVTNKLFQYMQAGLALVATDTAGQREIIAQAPGIGVLVQQDDPAALARAIDGLISNPVNLARARAQAAAEFHRRFSWEQNIPRIADLADRALH